MSQPSKIFRPEWGISENALLDFKVFPKTIVRSTRQMCQCDEACTKKSLLETSFFNKCQYFEIKNLLDDEKYYKSKLVNKEILWDQLVDENISLSEDIINFNIEDAVND